MAKPVKPVTSWKWEDRSHLLVQHTNKRIYRALLTNVYSVQVSDVESPQGTIQHLWIRRHDGQPVRSWADLQRIKNELTSPSRIGLEVFPDESELVDQANMYHLWVLPEGVGLPFVPDL